MCGENKLSEDDLLILEKRIEILVNKITSNLSDLVLNGSQKQKEQKIDSLIRQYAEENFIKKPTDSNIAVISRINIKIKEARIIYTTGYGKSGHIANYFADSLRSLGYISYYFTPEDFEHGNKHFVKNTDILIIFSAGGWKESPTFKWNKFFEKEKICAISNFLPKSEFIENIHTHNIYVIPSRMDVFNAKLNKQNNPIHIITSFIDAVNNLLIDLPEKST